jgi:hypothetical protein
MSGCSRSRRRDANASQSFENGVTFAVISAIATVVHTDIPALVIGVISLSNESPLFHLGTRPNGQCVTAEGTPQSSVSASMASCRSASPHSNVTPPHHACPLVAEREQSVESAALSGRRQDFSPCAKALGRLRVRWSCPHRAAALPRPPRGRACRPPQSASDIRPDEAAGWS